MDTTSLLDLRRREFLTRASALGAASLLGLHCSSAAAEPPPRQPRSGSRTHPSFVSRRSISQRSFCPWRGSPNGNTFRGA